MLNACHYNVSAFYPNMHLQPCTRISKSTAKPTTPNSSKRKSKHKTQMLKEVSLLEQCLTKRRQRLAVLLMMADKNRDYLITVDEFLVIMDKLRVPISQAAMEVVLTAIRTTKNSQLDYRVLLNGSLLKIVSDYLQRTEVEITVSTAAASEHSGQELQVHGEAQAMDTNGHCDQQRCLTPSTMDGENGKLSDDYKQEELRQFNALITYCKDNGIVLSCDSAKKGTVCSKVTLYCFSGYNYSNYYTIDSDIISFLCMLQLCGDVHYPMLHC